MSGADRHPGGERTDDGGAGDATRRRRVAELFSRALELDPEPRRTLLAAECAREPGLRSEVESLLAAAAAAGDYLGAGFDGDRAAVLIRDDEGARIPDRVGPYRLLHELGRGGMGAVYLAERADDAFRKQVAIKLVRGGWASAEALRRFRTERQVLATLEHPNIARLLDGGTTEDGLPYVVIELVDGEPIDEFCARQRLGIDERIGLFLAVCDAVAYAHRNLVVHRDIKPSNVLVAADGTPKLLDFGIAKLLEPGDDETAVATRGARPMTPAYASPEQVRGEAINTSSDIYSLGALLYELLTGRPPLQLGGKSSAEVERIVSELQPDPPQTGRRDLDNVVLAALRKEPAERYSTVAELAEDLRRFLGGHPVSARRATLAYRAGKYLRRHRFAAAAALAGLALLTATAAFYTRRLAVERDLARSEAGKARQVTELLVGLFRGPSSGRGAEVTAREILDVGARRLDVELRDQPEVHAELLTTVARVYLELDLLDEAASLAEQAIALRRELFGDDSAEVADSREVLAQVKLVQADYDAARELLGRVRDVRASRFGRESVEYAKALYGMASLEMQMSNDAQAAEILERVLPLRERLLGSDHLDVARTLNLLAIVSRRLDRPDRAEALYRRAITIYERTLGPDHPDLGRTLNNLAVLLSRTGRLEEARATYERALAIYERALGPDHDLVAGTLDNLGETLMDLGRPEEALPLVRRALDYREKHLGPHHRSTGTTLNTLANIYRELGRYDEAVPLYERAIAATEASLGKDHFWVAWPVANLAKLYVRKGEPERARPLFERALELRRNALGEKHTQVAFSLEDLAALETTEGHLAAAAALYRRAIAIRRALPDSPRDQLAETLRSLATTLAAQGRAEEAAAAEREAGEIGADGT